MRWNEYGYPTPDEYRTCFVNAEGLFFIGLLKHDEDGFYRWECLFSGNEFRVENSKWVYMNELDKELSDETKEPVFVTSMHREKTGKGLEKWHATVESIPHKYEVKLDNDSVVDRFFDAMKNESPVAITDDMIV